MIVIPWLVGWLGLVFGVFFYFFCFPFLSFTVLIFMVLRGESENIAEISTTLMQWTKPCKLCLSTGVWVVLFEILISMLL